MSIDVLEAVLLVVLGGLFGVFLGRLPEKWIYAIACAAAVLAIVVISRGQVAT